LSAYDFVHSDKIYFTDGSLCWYWWNV
jgi:hypothetical protein